MPSNPPNAEARLAPVTFSERTKDNIAAVVTGQAAGLAMLGTMILIAVAQGHPWHEPLYAIGSLAYLLSGITAPASPVVGFVVHQFGFVVFWSLVFGMLAHHASRREMLSVTAVGMEDPWGVASLGPIVGVVSQTMDVVIVMPMITQDAAWAHIFLGISGWIFHLVFGIVLMAFPWVRRWMFPQRERAGFTPGPA